MVAEGKRSWMLGKLRHGTRKVREVVDDSEIVDEIFRYFGADQTLDFPLNRHGLRSFLTYGVRRNRRIPWAALIVQRGRLWEAGVL